MTLAILYYLVSRLSAIQSWYTVLITANVIAGIGWFVAAIFSFSGQFNTDEELKFKKFTKIWLKLVLLPTVLLTTFLPSEKDAYIMLGAYATQQVVSNEDVQQVAKDVGKTVVDTTKESFIGSKETVTNINTLINSKLKNLIEEETTKNVKK